MQFKLVDVVNTDMQTMFDFFLLLSDIYLIITWIAHIEDLNFWQTFKIDVI